MKVYIAVIIGMILGFLIPAILVSYVNWDMYFITTMGSWNEDSRFTMGFGSFVTSLAGSCIAYILAIDKVK